ncbi:MAG: minichromosome maintenance protein MCM [Asgard group archaeon]|nr:minichromosome maintenance protein MCM [Asgard group archaeon]
MVVDPREKKEAFTEFIREFRDEEGNYIYRQRIQEMTVQDEISLEVDFNDLIKFSPQLAEFAINEPEEYVNAGDEAVLDVIKIEDIEYAEAKNKFFIRFYNLTESETISLRSIRSEHVGRFIMLTGIITRATVVKPLLVVGHFQCLSCIEEYIVVHQEDQRFTPPLRCTNPSCGKAGPFKLLVESSSFIDWQKINIQERPEDLPPGQMPRSVSVLITNDMVDIVRPGDRVSVIGVLKSVPDFSMKKSGKLATFHINMHSNNVVPEEKEYDSIEISEEEEQIILELSRDPWVHKKIIESIAPSIYGNEDIKESIALLLFGGVAKELQDGLKIRGESNILMIGDPGTAKSQMLRYVATLAPRALYTSGKGTSAAGLTVAVLRDAETGEFTLEAGALVLSDRGVCCIDELDKMRKEDRSSIHEALEQRTVSVAKAGIVATLNARCSIIAAANPKLGRYVPHRSAAENINLPVTILSRFDLIWIVRDEPEAGSDKIKAEHILRLHTAGVTEREPEIDKDLLKKYISYAKLNCKPKLSEEAARRLEEYYLEMRDAGEDARDSPIAITARQLESLIRLTESHARIALRNEATIDDAEAAIRLLRESLRQVGIDPESGKPDIDVIYSGTTTTKRSRIDQLNKLIQELEDESKNQMVSIDDLVERGAGLGLDRDYIEKNLEQMKNYGEIYFPKQGFVRRVGS